MVIAKERLFIDEYFYSLQGEGAYSGVAALFIRLSGCGVHCPWCDSPRSWRRENGTEMTVAELSKIVSDSGTKIVVITGGEPMMHNLDELCAELHRVGVRIHLETSGSEEFSGDFDWITLSPKHNKACREEYFGMASELKVVISSEEDIEWADGMVKKVKDSCLALLQSEWSRRETIYPLLVDYILKDSRWRLSLQTHKYLNIE